HRYEFNREFEKTLVAAGLRITGRTPDENYVEIVEVPDHPWFLGCQFHPEFKSKPLEPHPLFAAFIGASLEHKLQKQRPTTAASPEHKLQKQRPTTAAAVGEPKPPAPVFRAAPQPSA